MLCLKNFLDNDPAKTANSIFFRTWIIMKLKVSQGRDFYTGFIKGRGINERQRSGLIDI